MFLIMVVTIFYLPIILPLLLPDVEVDPWAIAQSLIVTMLIPLVIGMLIKSHSPDVAGIYAPTMNKISSLSVLILLVVGLGMNLSNILSFIGTRGLGAILLLILGALAIGLLFGGRDPGVRSAMGLSTANRNGAAALLVATQNFSGTDTLPFVLVVIFGGYRLFLFLLPIWGFFAVFLLGAQTIHYLFDVGLLATVTGWVVGFFAGLLFAVLSYLFYFIAVGIVSFSIGYDATVGVLAWIGLDGGFQLWLIAVVVGVLLAFVVYTLNLQKYAIIVATAEGGTGIIIYTLLVLFNGALAVSLLENPVRLTIDQSFWWLLFFLVVAGLGIVAQIQAIRSFEADTYNRLAEIS
jgi:hypothetical protein